MDNGQVLLGNFRVATLGNGKVLIPAFTKAGVAAPIVSNALDVGERRAVCLPGLDVLGVHSTADRLPGGRPKPRFRKFFPNGFVS